LIREFCSLGEVLEGKLGAFLFQTPPRDVTRPLTDGPLAPTTLKQGGVGLYTNGIDTLASDAARIAKGSVARLEFLSVMSKTAPSGCPWISPRLERRKQRRAAESGRDEFIGRGAIRALQSGKSVYLVGHSEGAVVTKNAINGIVQWGRTYGGMSDAQINGWMADIHVVTIGGAASAESWPAALGSVTHLVNPDDLVASNLGAGRAGERRLVPHSEERYLPYIKADHFKSSRTIEVDTRSSWSPEVVAE
jgi:hypothetical protein